MPKRVAESVTSCHRLKLPAADGKNYLTDVATAETLLRIVQSVPSPKAEPIKLWLAKVGYERMQEMVDPALSRARRGSGARGPRARAGPPLSGGPRGRECPPTPEGGRARTRKKA